MILMVMCNVGWERRQNSEQMDTGKKEIMKTETPFRMEMQVLGKWVRFETIKY